jgi:hypothetical protein
MIVCEKDGSSTHATERSRWRGLTTRWPRSSARFAHRCVPTRQRRSSSSTRSTSTGAGGTSSLTRIRRASRASSQRLSCACHWLSTYREPADGRPEPAAELLGEPEYGATDYFENEASDVSFYAAAAILFDIPPLSTARRSALRAAAEIADERMA